MNFIKIPQETPENWFWEVRGRKWAPGPSKYLIITVVFTPQRKGAISLQNYGFLVKSRIPVHLWEIN